MADTRKDRRAPVSLKVRFKSATVDEFIEQYSKDVSRGGIFIKSSQPMAVGTLLKFQFQLKDESALIRGVGRVVWTRAEEDAGAERPAGMGIKFIKMDGESKAMVERILDAHGGAPGAYESGRETATQAEPYSDRPPANGGSGGGGSFFPDTTPMNELPAPEDRTAVRHAAQFLASALSEAATDEAAAREAEQKAEEARHRTQQIEAQRAADAEKRKKAATGGEALPSMIIDPSLGNSTEEEHTEPVPRVPESQIPTMAGLKPVEVPPPAKPGKSPSKPPPKAAAKTPSLPPGPPANANAQKPNKASKSEKPPKPSKSEKPAAAKAAPKPSPAADEDTSITDRKQALKQPSVPPASSAPAPAKRKRSLVPVIVITAAIIVAAFLALRGGGTEEPVTVVEEQPEVAPADSPPAQPEPPAQVAPAPEPTAEPAAQPAPEPAPTPEPEPEAPQAVQVPPTPAPEPAPAEPVTDVEARTPASNRLGRVRIISTPMGASVFINDKPRGKTPVMIDLSRAMTHTITARAPGYNEASQLVTPSGNLSVVKLELAPLPFVLHVDTVPSGASVTAGGKRGTSPVDIQLVAPPKGPLVITATLPGYASTVGKVGPGDFSLQGGTMRASVKLDLEPPSEKPEPRPTPAPPVDTAPKPEPEAPKPAPAPEAPKPEPAPAENLPDNPFGQ